MLWVTALVVLGVSIHAGDDGLQSQLAGQDVAYYSDISGVKLEVGHWYHKWGTERDITDEEWKVIPVAEKSGFRSIKDQKDVKGIKKESVITNIDWTPPVIVAQHKSQESVENEVVIVGEVVKSKENDEGAPKESINRIKDLKTIFVKDNTHSSNHHPSTVSGDLLVPGQWYHLVSEDYDVSSAEYLQLPLERQNHFIRIDSEEQYEHQKKLDERIRVNEFRSSRTGTKLTLGNWYHNARAQEDLTSAEWHLLPAERKSKYIAVNKVDVLCRIMEETGAEEKPARDGLSLMAEPHASATSSYQSDGLDNNLPPAPHWAVPEDQSQPFYSVPQSRAAAVVTHSPWTKSLPNRFPAIEKLTPKDTRKSGSMIIQAMKMKRESSPQSLTSPVQPESSDSTNKIHDSPVMKHQEGNMAQ